jgi:DNA-binding CsgD family transcriptional regulator
MISDILPGRFVDMVIDELALPLLVLDGRRVLYANSSAIALAARLEREHTIDLAVLLRAHAEAVGGHLQEAGRTVTLITAGNGEPFYIHLRQIAVRRVGPLIVACVRQMAPERDAVKECYGLSDREAQIVDLVLKGYGNRDIATTLNITPGTTKKHMTRIFDKVGVDSRSQLMARLA